MEKKVVYTNFENRNVIVGFDSVKTCDVGAYFYSENVITWVEDLVLFLPITKAFVIVNKDVEICDTPLC
jgi:hypothetical protein